MRRKGLFLLPGILIGLLFSIIIFRSMAWGPWAYNDSSAYVSAARNIAVGNGSVILHSTGKIKQLTEFPPFYPFFLSVFGGAGGNYILIIRWVNAILFGLTIFLFFLIVKNLTGQIIISTVFTLFFASFKFIIETFAGAMSETLFLFLLFLSLVFFQYFLQFNKRAIWLGLLALVSACLPITRYAGILFIGVFGFCILLIDRAQTFLARLKQTAIYFLVSYLPIAVWALSLLREHNQFAGKNFIFSWSIFGSILNSIQNILNLLIQWIPYVSEYPDTWLSVVLGLIGGICFLLILVTPFVLYLRNQSQNLSWIFPFMLAIDLALIGYFGLIIFMHTTSSPPIDIIHRTILPLFPLTLFLSASLISLVFQKTTTKTTLAVSLLLVSTVILRYQLLITRPYLQNLEENGIGYTSRVFQQSGIIQAINAIDQDRVLISNLSGFVLFHTNRYPIFIEMFPQYSFGARESYGEAEFREENAALIILKSEFSNYYGENADALLKQVTDSLVVDYEDAQGVIYSYRPPSTQP